MLVGFAHFSFATHRAVAGPVPDSLQPCRKCDLWQ